MYYKRKPLSKMSERGKLRKAIGELHFQLLCLKRSKRCEICGQDGPVGRFHILEVSTHPRLEFEEENILLAHWMNGCQAHYLWHHYGSHDPRNKRTDERIQALRGTEWEQRLREIEWHKDPHTENYLRLLYMKFKQELGI